MLDEYLRRDDVSDFIERIKTNERYFEKELGRFDNYSFTVSFELSLYIFYYALFLYKTILNDVYLFDEYLEQLEKIYKKFNNFDDMIEAIHKLIGKMVATHFKIEDVEDTDARCKLVKYIYDNYITDGYLIHGFNTSYTESIYNKGLIPEEYENYYEDFQKINELFEKYNVKSIMNKDFSEKKIHFTDDFISSCYYSNYAPMYFSSFLENDEYFGKRNRQDGYLIDNYDLATYSLKKFIHNNLVKEEDRKFLYSLVKKEWDLLHREDKKISLLFVKRNKIHNNEVYLEEYLKDESGYYEIVDRLLSSKYYDVSYGEKINTEDFEIISLDSYYDKKEDEEVITFLPEEEYYEYKEKEVNQEFLDVYGKTSILLLLGSILITLGVIITIIMILKGM